MAAAPPNGSRGSPPAGRGAPSPVDALAALVGEPTGQELSRSRVESLGFSTKQAQLPQGMTRREYVAARPGRETALAVDLAGIGSGRWRWAHLALLAAALGAVVAVWLLG